MEYLLPEDFQINFEKIDFNTHRLTTYQTISVSQEKCFEFFKDPCNLFEITPDWLDFKMTNCQKVEVYEGAEFEYSIRVFGLKIRWRSRIIDYKPPQRFTDIQLIGPYKSWEHLHIFEETPKGTLMRDIVTYKVYIYSVPLLGIINQKLLDIFSYRSTRINEWATGNFRRKSIIF